MSNKGQTSQLTKRTTKAEETAPMGELMTLPPWLQALRDSMAGSIKADDLKSIMEAQVTKAKEGDMRAASFVFGQAHKLLASERKQVSITQNNYYGDAERPDTPAAAEPGTTSKIDKMRARAGAREPLTSDADTTFGRPVSDEEEKELRRREAEQGEE